MSIPLHPPLTRSAANLSYPAVALTEGPAYILGRPSPRYEPRWHRVRSGHTVRTVIGREITVWGTWCGPSHLADHCVALDVLPPGQPVCGTCDGRADGVDPAKTGRVFSPYGLTPPAWCPSKTLYVTAGYNVGRCLACGQLAPLRYSGSPYNPREIITRHAPLALVDPCPFHAWRSLTAVDDTTARCECGQSWPASGQDGTV